MNNSVGKVIIAGNWKMHKNRQEARQLAEAIKAVVSTQSDLPEIVLIPPYTALDAVGSCIEKSPISLGSQNMDYRESGAYTGEISPLMLADLKVKYVLIGHSERRQFFGETNSTTNLRLKAALAHGLKPILCVGETLDERENNLTDAVVGRQVAAALADVDSNQMTNIVLAYEPVWAIGTGQTCYASEANRVAALIRTTISRLYSPKEGKGSGSESSSKKFNADSIPVLYGGSVKPSNIDEQLQEVQIDGSLVGGASLAASDFLALIEAGRKRVKLVRSKSAAVS